MDIAPLGQRGASSGMGAVWHIYINIKNIGNAETAMAKTKNDIKLVSSANTGFFYVTKKNPKNNTKKLELKKYDPVARKHVVFKEGKIKESKKS